MLRAESRVMVPRVPGARTPPRIHAAPPPSPHACDRGSPRLLGQTRSGTGRMRSLELRSAHLPSHPPCPQARVPSEPQCPQPPDRPWPPLSSLRATSQLLRCSHTVGAAPWLLHSFFLFEIFLFLLCFVLEKKRRGGERMRFPNVLLCEGGLRPRGSSPLSRGPAAFCLTHLSCLRLRLIMLGACYILVLVKTASNRC